MRTPFVKRHTPPLSGFLLFFRFPGSGAASSRGCVLTCFPGTGANQTWLHHTLLEVQSPRAWRVQSTVCVLLCALDIMLCPHTVLRKRPAEHVALASA